MDPPKYPLSFSCLSLEVVGRAQGRLYGLTTTFQPTQMSSWGNRVCAACHQDLSIDDYSTNQWSKGLGVSRCRLCVSEGIQVRKKTKEVNLEMTHPIKKGGGGEEVRRLVVNSHLTANSYIYPVVYLLTD